MRSKDVTCLTSLLTSVCESTLQSCDRAILARTKTTRISLSFKHAKRKRKQWSDRTGPEWTGFAKSYLMCYVKDQHKPIVTRPDGVIIDSRSFGARERAERR